MSDKPLEFNTNGHHCNGTPWPVRFDIDSSARTKAPRIAFYSHDTQGLGHVRRNLLIAKSLCKGEENPVILLLSGVREAAAFAMPAGVDCLTLPSLGKDIEGKYFSRSLGISVDDLIDVRSKAISAVLKSFQPDVFIVDKVPLGAFSELKPALNAMRVAGKTKVVLGLRDVLDDPETVHHEWINGEYDAAIREYFDQIWVYGDQALYDPVKEYSFAPDIAEKVCFSGYLNPRDVDTCEPTGEVDTLHHVTSSNSEIAVCVVGGGRDGLPLAESFTKTKLPDGMQGILVTGPLMPEDARAYLRTSTIDNPNLHILEFVTNPCPLLERADHVIAMGGYNTVCETLSYGKRALIVPRVLPRTEQLIRATNFAARGLINMLHPDDLSPEALSVWLTKSDGSSNKVKQPVDFGGVEKLQILLEELLEPASQTRERTHVAK